MGACKALRAKLNERGAKVSYNDIILKAMAVAAAEYPYANASYTDTAIRIFDDMNAGLAVSIEGGLVVPVVAGVNALNIRQIAQRTKALVEKARQGKLTAEEMSGGTVTLSNLGMYPVRYFTAILNPPEACILALGTMEEKPVARNGEMVLASVMTITATFDHRVIDGAYGAAYLKELRELLENPALLGC